MARNVKKERNTSETQISMELNIDGKGNCTVDTGIGFFDHMLNSFARHSGFDLNATLTGDLHVDGHHTVEDTGIVLGELLKEAVGDKKGIKRYGNMILPMDDALVLCAIDFCGRPYFSFDAKFPTERIGYLDCELVKEFFYAISYSAGMNLHIKLLSGDNSHHICEAMFKAFAYAVSQAVSIGNDSKKVLSTKGTLA